MMAKPIAAEGWNLFGGVYFCDNFRTNLLSDLVEEEVATSMID